MDMPKTLAEIAPSAFASVRDPKTLPIGEEAEVMALIADFIGKSSHLDVMLAEVMAQAAGPNAAPLVSAIRDNTRASSVSSSILAAAISHVLSPRDAELFRAVSQLCSKTQAPRDLFAHHIYLSSPAVTDAVLLLDPKVWIPFVTSRFGSVVENGKRVSHAAHTSSIVIPRDLNDQIYAINKWHVIEYGAALADGIALMTIFLEALRLPGDSLRENIRLQPKVAAYLATLNKGRGAQAAQHRWPPPAPIW